MTDPDQCRFDGHFEFVATVLLALAAVASAWAVYQGSTWRGEQARMTIFAASLFFAGISTRLHTRAPGSVVLGLGYALFLGTVVWILTFPVNVPV